MKRKIFRIQIALLGIAATTAFYFDQALIGGLLSAAVVVRTWIFEQKERERVGL